MNTMYTMYTLVSVGVCVGVWLGVCAVVFEMLLPIVKQYVCTCCEL